MKYLLIYLAVINFISAAVCIFDKNQARRRGRRISERTLFRLSFAGGAAAMYITMLIIRHKTLHKRFMIGLPLIMIVHISLIFLLTKCGV